MAGAFLWDDRVRSAIALTSAAGTPVASLPVSNLLDPQPRLRARWLGGTAPGMDTVDIGRLVAGGCGGGAGQSGWLDADVQDRRTRMMPATRWSAQMPADTTVTR